MTDQKPTDSIPRANVGQVFQVLRHLAGTGGRSTFDDVRVFLVKRSPRIAPSSRSAMYTVARDVLLDLQKLEFIQARMLPRTQSQLETLSESPCELTETGNLPFFASATSEPGRGRVEALRPFTAPAFLA